MANASDTEPMDVTRTPRSTAVIPGPVPEYINHGTIGKERNPYRSLRPVHRPLNIAIWSQSTWYGALEYICTNSPFSSAPPCLIVFRSTVCLDVQKHRWRNWLLSDSTDTVRSTHKEVGIVALFSDMFLTCRATGTATGGFNNS